MRERRHLTTVGLLACLAGILVLPPLLAPGTGTVEGTDALVTSLLQDAGVRPWATPLLPPPDAAGEGLLFAAQAALGAGVLGYALGRLGRVRRGDPPRPADRPPTDGAGG